MADLNKELYKDGFCRVDCVYFPDMAIRSDFDWVIHESGFYKVRKDKKEFKCLYDDQPIDWHRPCPRCSG